MIFYAVAYRNEGGKWLGLAKYPWTADPEKADGLRKWLNQHKPEFDYALAEINVTPQPEWLEG